MRASFADPPDCRRQKFKTVYDIHKLPKRLSRQNSINKGLGGDDYDGGVPVSVPFRWESEPGTPKPSFPGSSLPPLTPPPSYFYSSPKTQTLRKKPPKPSLLGSITKPSGLGSIFAKRATRKANINPSSLSTSSSSSSSSSSRSSSSSYSMFSPPKRASNFRARADDDDDDDDEEEEEEEEEEEIEYENPKPNKVSSAVCLARANKPRNWYSLIKVLLKGAR